MRTAWRRSRIGHFGASSCLDEEPVGAALVEAAVPARGERGVHRHRQYTAGSKPRKLPWNSGRRDTVSRSTSARRDALAPITPGSCRTGHASADNREPRAVTPPRRRPRPRRRSDQMRCQAQHREVVRAHELAADHLRSGRGVGLDEGQTRAGDLREHRAGGAPEVFEVWIGERRVAVPGLGLENLHQPTRNSRRAGHVGPPRRAG